MTYQELLDFLRPLAALLAIGKTEEVARALSEKFDVPESVVRVGLCRAAKKMTQEEE